MIECLQQFAQSSRKIEHLLALASRPVIQEDSTALNTWILQAKMVLDGTSRLIQVQQPQLAELKSAPEVQNYRRQLELLRAKVEHFEQVLLTRTVTLRAREQQVTQVRAWADAVGRLT